MKIPVWKRLASYLVPLEIMRRESQISGKVQISLINGRLCLDSPSANYSFGSLHRVFKDAFRYGGLKRSNPQRVLVLGLGGGSVPTIIYDELGLSPGMVAVEIDPLMVELSRTCFGMDRFSNLRIETCDALVFLKRDISVFDTIVIDLFIDDHVPPAFTGNGFFSELEKHVHPAGSVYFNFIIRNSEDEQRKNNVLKSFGSWNGNVAEYTFPTGNVVIAWFGN